MSDIARRSCGGTSYTSTVGIGDKFTPQKFPFKQFAKGCNRVLYGTPTHTPKDQVTVRKRAMWNKIKAGQLPADIAQRILEDPANAELFALFAKEDQKQ